MMRLENTWFVAAFHSTLMHDPGPEEFQRPARVCVCRGASVRPCLLSCCCGVEDRPPFGDFGCALRHRPALVLRSNPGVDPWLPHEELANGEGSSVTRFFNPARSGARNAHSVNTAGRPKCSRWRWGDRPKAISLPPATRDSRIQEKFYGAEYSVDDVEVRKHEAFHAGKGITAPR